MKYIKTYEAKERLTVGKYVICKDYSLDRRSDSEEGIIFLENNIGKLVNIEFHNKMGSFNDYPYCVRYENVPKEVSELFSENPDYLNRTGSRWFSREEILHFSSNKEKLEIKIARDKYNL